MQKMQQYLQVEEVKLMVKTAMEIVISTILFVIFTTHDARLIFATNNFDCEIRNRFDEHCKSYQGSGDFL